MIRDITINDADACTQIYNYYILNTVVTFEEEVITTLEMQSRIKETTESLPWLVFEDNGTVLGYAYASKWKGRCAYRFTAETTVYLDEKARGRGIGSQLYTELLNRLKALNYHTAMVELHSRMMPVLPFTKKWGLLKLLNFVKQVAKWVAG